MRDLADLDAPPGWATAALGTALPIQYGKALPERARDGVGTHPVIGSSGVVGRHSVALTSGPTLVIGRKGSVGQVHYIGTPCWPIDTAYFAIGHESLDLLYFRYLLERLDLRRLDRSTAVPSLGRDDYNDLRVPVAPLPEQHRIVAAIEQHLSRIDAGVAALEKVKKELARYRASVLKAACEGQLVPTEAALARAEGRSFEPASELLARILAERRVRWDASDSKRRKKYVEPEPPDQRKMPEGWVLTTLGAAFRVFVGATPSRGEPSYWNGGIPWVSSGEVAFRRISRTRETITQLGLENSSTKLHPPGSVLLGMIGEGKTRGQAAILDIEACNNQNCAAIRVSETPVSPEQVYYYLWSVYGETRQIGSGNNQPALNKTLVEQLPIPLPPLAEQHRIVAEVERRLSIADEVSTAVESALARAARLRQSVLKRAFEGRLVPQDPSDEPASALLERVRREGATAHRAPGRARGDKR